MATTIDASALFTVSYGLYVLTARDGGRDGGCIVNTVCQLTDQPKRISVCVCKQNLTCEMIQKSGLFNVSVLTQSVPFSEFQHFGFQSGRDVDKLSLIHI